MAIPTGAAAPKVRSPLFFGWYIVGIAFVAQFVSAGTQVYAAGVFLKPMTTDLGWSRGQYSLVQTVSTVVMGVVGFSIGARIDKQGPRLLMFIGGIICGASLIATSQVHNLWEFYLARGVAQTVGGAMLGNLVVNVTVARWFVARRGMAISIASAGVSLGGVLLTPVVGWWVGDYGWREAWVFLGIMVWVLILPSALIIRRSPEDRGLHPDGMNPEEASAYTKRRKRMSAATEVQWTRPEAIRTTTIWYVIFAYGVANIGLGAMLIHLIPFLTDHGWSRAEATALFGIQSWLALLSKPLWGLLMDRFHARYLSAFGFVVSAIGVLAVLAATKADSTPLVAIAVATYGFGIGGTVPLQETVWASYFGRMHLGKIRSVAMPFTIIFGAGGPFMAGWLFDRTGNYTLAFMLFSMFSVIGFLLILLAKPPVRKVPPSGPIPAGVEGQPG